MFELENGIYIGRWINEDGDNYVYRVAQIQDICRTIPEYGTPAEWTKAQQVLCYKKSKPHSDEFLAMKHASTLLKFFRRCEKVEKINYDVVFPENMEMQEAIEYITSYSREDMIKYLNGELDD